jgi:branched-chain amino acid transport system permease protein
VTAIIAYIVIARLVYLRAGRAMIALRENEPLATSVGIEVTRYLVLSAVVSAAIAGMAGARYAQYVRIVDPNVFLFVFVSAPISISWRRGTRFPRARNI